MESLIIITGGPWQALIKSEPKMKSNGGDEKLKYCVNAEDINPFLSTRLAYLFLILHHKY